MAHAYAFRICSHWNGSTSSIDGEEYPSQQEAIDRVRDLIGDDAVATTYDDQYANSIAFYRDEEDAERDAEGAAPFLVLAAIRKVRIPENEEVSS